MNSGAVSRDPTLKHLAVEELIFNRRVPAIGFDPARVGLPLDDSDLKRVTPTALFRDVDPHVRAMIATALPDVFTTDETMAAALLVLKTQILVEKDETVLGAMLESIGRMPHKTDTDRNDAEHQIIGVMNRDRRPGVVLGAVRGLDWLTRRNPRRTVGDDVRTFLRDATTVGVTTVAPPTIAGEGSAEAPGKDADEARTRRIAVTVLQTLHDTDITTIRHAAQSGDWQVRRLVASQLDSARPEQVPIMALLLEDPDFHVRYDLVTPLTRDAQRTKSCARLIKLLDDPSPAVVIHVLDSFPGGCDKDEQDAAIDLMTRRAEVLRSAQGDTAWHIPAHSLMALARLAPERAAPIVEVAASHPIWQVRADVATAAGTLRQEDRLMALAEDAEPNVGTAAIDGLIAMKSPKMYNAAIGALQNGDDHQLLLSAALALKGAPADVRGAAIGALQRGLDRLTEEKSDNSRDARVGILDRLGEILPPENVAVLERYVGDSDPAVRQAASKAIKGLIANDFELANGGQTRYPLQVTYDELATLPTTAHIAMTDGTAFDMQLLVDQAPATVAWFVHYVKAGYYDGLTIHRVEPNFVIQGGSPHANEYSGAPRFMRDELGTEPNLRGSVGLSTRGHDTGDGQFFVDLTDQPRLDHTYTVFARVTAGLDVIDRMLEGAKIQHVTVH